MATVPKMGAIAVSVPSAKAKAAQSARIVRGYGDHREINTCSKCNGSGEVIEARDVCTECNGECTVETAKYIKVDIKRGMENGETIIFKGESDEAPNVEAGDLVVVVEEAEHEYFKRSYSNLLYEKDVQLSEALLGAAFAIRHLDDRIIIAHTPEGTNYDGTY
ncbi:Mitochondrial protein import protein mas5 [Histomonas meleagridis]|nr:Mitochondrial protein import protein mas5 [Histomonas meleagridis]